MKYYCLDLNKAQPQEQNGEHQEMNMGQTGNPADAQRKAMFANMAERKGFSRNYRPIISRDAIIKQKIRNRQNWANAQRNNQAQQSPQEQEQQGEEMKQQQRQNRVNISVGKSLKKIGEIE